MPSPTDHRRKNGGSPDGSRSYCSMESLPQTSSSRNGVTNRALMLSGDPVAENVSKASHCLVSPATLWRNLPDSISAATTYPST